MRLIRSIFLPRLESSGCPCHYYPRLLAWIFVSGSCPSDVRLWCIFWSLLFWIGSLCLWIMRTSVNLLDTWDLSFSFVFHLGLGEWSLLSTLTRPMSAWFCSIFEFVLRLRVVCSRPLHKGKLTTVLLHRLNHSPCRCLLTQLLECLSLSIISEPPVSFH